MRRTYEICIGSTLEALHRKIKHITDHRVSGADVRVIETNHRDDGYFEALVELYWKN